jgi:hypothetical protein
MREERDGPSPPDCRQRRRRLISLCVPNEHTHARLQTACSSAGRRRRGGGQRCRRHAASSSAKQTSRDIIACMVKTSGSYGSLVNSPLLSALRVCFQPFLSLTEEFFLTTSNLGRVTGGKKNPLKLQDK